jgi:hypothetical protein
LERAHLGNSLGRRSLRNKAQNLSAYWLSVGRADLPDSPASSLSSAAQVSKGPSSAPNSPQVTLSKQSEAVDKVYSNGLFYPPTEMQEDAGMYLMTTFAATYFIKQQKSKP